jgi:hypothetical protein
MHHLSSMEKIARNESVEVHDEHSPWEKRRISTCQERSLIDFTFTVAPFFLAFGSFGGAGGAFLAVSSGAGPESEQPGSRTAATAMTTTFNRLAKVKDLRDENFMEEGTLLVHWKIKPFAIGMERIGPSLDRLPFSFNRPCAFAYAPPRLNQDTSEHERCPGQGLGSSKLEEKDQEKTVSVIRLRLRPCSWPISHRGRC